MAKAVEGALRIDRGDEDDVAHHPVARRIGSRADRGRVEARHRREHRVAVEEGDALGAQAMEVRRVLRIDAVGAQAVEHEDQVQRGAGRRLCERGERT